MAENKKSFILYIDLINTINQLPDEKAGALFKHILEYVNDNNPITDDLLLNIAFEPIKQQLKRDLIHWESIKHSRSESGKKGGRPKKQSKAKKPNALFEKQSKANKAVNDNVTVSVNDNVNKEKYISKIQEKFYQSLILFINDFDKKTIREFYDYWSEPNKSNTKIKYQLERTWDTKRRLQRWTKNNFNEKNRTNNKGFKSDTTREAIESVTNGFIKYTPRT